MKFGFQHSNPLSLIGRPTVGKGDNEGQCAAIAQELVPGLKDHPVADWMPGVRVKNAHLPAGTVIAIFDTHGTYLGQKGYDYSHGKAHTALYIRQSSQGIEVVHQHAGAAHIKGTLIRFGGDKLREFSTTDFKVESSNSTIPSLRFLDQRLSDHKSGVSRPNVTGKPVVTPEDDADNYYVVELKPHKVASTPVQKLDADFSVQLTNSTVRSEK